MAVEAAGYFVPSPGEPSGGGKADGVAATTSPDQPAQTVRGFTAIALLVGVGAAGSAVGQPRAARRTA